MTTRMQTVLLALAAGGALAQDAQPDAFERMLAHYEGLDGCAVKMAVEMRSEDPTIAGVLATMGQTTPGYAVKPNRFAFWDEKEGAAGMGMPAPELYCDGEQLVSALPSREMYSVEQAPTGFAELVEKSRNETTEAWQMLPGTIFVFGLMSERPREALDAFVKDVQYKGVGGDGAYHIVSATQFDGAGGTLPLEMHISAEGDPWLLSVTPSFGDEGAAQEIEVVLSFEDWKETGTAPEEGKITPDPEWKKVDHLGEAIMESMRPAPEESQDQPAQDSGASLEGQPAPEFELSTVGGGDFRLADHKGKVVVLDFWATWCPPCVRGLPTMDKVTGEYAPKGVVFAAVNVAEERDAVASFMEQRGWDFTSPLDADGKVSESYGVSGIPHSVIIDKKGVVRHVHVGFGGPEEAEARLREQLDALVAEK